MARRPRNTRAQSSAASSPPVQQAQGSVRGSLLQEMLLFLSGSAIAIMATLIVINTAWVGESHTQQVAPALWASVRNSSQLLGRLLNLPEADITRWNLACAQGLPEVESLGTDTDARSAGDREVSSVIVEITANHSSHRCDEARKFASRLVVLNQGQAQYILGADLLLVQSILELQGLTSPSRRSELPVPGVHCRAAGWRLDTLCD